DYEIIDPLLESDGEALSNILSQYYEKRGAYPRQVLVPFELEDAPELEQLFAQGAGRRVTVTTPKRGEKNAHVRAAMLNAEEEVRRIAAYEEKYLKTLKWLQNALQLPTLPKRIEAYDISNTGSSDIVASMTVFVNGRPSKREYRRFKIKSITVQDDYASMAEVIERRMARFNEADEKFNTLPDVMFIDGGENHAKAALGSVLRSGHALPIFGVVKDDRHRTRALVTTEGQEISISADPAVFAFVGTIQEETHRFAIEFHRSQHTKHTINSTLESIPNVGAKRRADLMKFFGSVRAIKAASKEELIKVVPRNAANAIFEYFHSESGG
ncbi:MAG: excinuclease ABC subunit UvrC, partial [Oscillospiraceae bacterium]|nr:excinuclease ABC subunit UvrC [Oscillospiraceae bacterium]